jgi:polysaccharide pyruvyl transferase WcaK-like protein
MSKDRSAKNIALINVWGMNRGDEAMQRALIIGLKDTFPRLTVNVFSNSPIDLPQGTTVFSWSDLPLYSLTRWVSTKKMSLRSSYHLVRGLINRSYQRRSAIAALQSCDIVISAPAGPYIGEFYPNEELICLANLRLAKYYNKPCVIAATSAGPFAQPSRNMIRRLALSDVSWWTLRDPISFDAVKSLNLKNTEIETVSDLVFSRVIIPDKYRMSRYEKSEISSLINYIGNPTIGVTLNTTPYIHSSGIVHPINEEQYVSEMSRFLQQVFEYTRGQLLFFPHHYGTEREMKLIRRVINQLGDNVNLRVVPPFLNSDCQQILISYLSMYISHRYHPTIFALQQSVPVFCITHQFKTDSLLKLFHYPVAMPDSLSPSHTWFSAFKEVWDQKKDVTNYIQHKLPEIRATSAHTISRVINTLLIN